jgi:hypothetical protein
VDGAVGQMAMVAAALLAGLVLAWALFAILGRTDRTARREINRARGTERPEWAPGIWHCAACFSTNPPTAERCARCREPRRGLAHAPIEVRPDWIPDRIEVPPATVVTLVHDPRAHLDPSEAHWQMRVGGRTMGSAALRDGALALLRSLDGVEVIALDVRGTGTSQYRVTDVIARFEARRFPLEVPCPEAAR